VGGEDGVAKKGCRRENGIPERAGSNSPAQYAYERLTVPKTWSLDSAMNFFVQWTWE